MDKKLKVLVLGTGFAGQGHTEAFRNVGAEVVGMVGRTENVLAEVAKKKNLKGVIRIPASGATR